MSGKPLCILLLAVSPWWVAAQIERQHAAHMHGEATVSLSQEQTRFELELELPGANIVGFEHRYHTAAEKAAVEQALAWLTRTENWLRHDARGGCVTVSANAHTHGYHEEDDHDHDEHNHDHAEFHVRVVLECARPDRLRWLELGLIERFPGNEVLIVNRFTAGGQGQDRLVPGQVRVMLP